MTDTSKNILLSEVQGCQRRSKSTIRECGQNPRLFLKEEKDFGKVHQGREAEGNRFLHQVLQAGHPGLKELGYPNERHTLVNWYRGYEEKGEVKDDDLIIECKPEVSLDEICGSMSQVPDWMPGLKLDAAGYETPWYCKD